MAATVADHFARRLALVREQMGGGPARPVVEPRPLSPWMSTADLAEYLRLTTRYDPLQSARRWARRHALVAVVRNGELLFARRDVERALAADDERQARGAHRKAQRNGSTPDGAKAEDAQKGRPR